MDSEIHLIGNVHGKSYERAVILTELVNMSKQLFVASASEQDPYFSLLKNVTVENTKETERTEMNESYVSSFHHYLSNMSSKVSKVSYLWSTLSCPRLN